MKGKVIDTLTCMVAVGILMPVFGVPEAQTSGRTLGERQRLPGYVVVTPEGPRDGGDIGPYTPGTKTSGIQEALNYAKSNRRDVYLAGGAIPKAFTEGVIYKLEETMQIPWMQDFRLDSDGRLGNGSARFCGAFSRPAIYPPSRRKTPLQLHHHAVVEMEGAGIRRHGVVAVESAWVVVSLC